MGNQQYHTSVYCIISSKNYVIITTDNNLINSLNKMKNEIFEKEK